MREFAIGPLWRVFACFGLTSSLAVCVASSREDYVRAPMPPGFQVVLTELEGPVFADAHGKTLYKWPYQLLRGGYVGDQKGMSTCVDVVAKASAGLFSPYPPGLILPELDSRPSCVALWPPVIAPADAKPIDKWTLLTRPDGSRQWAYSGQALYTSALDHEPGDVLGGTNRAIMKLSAVALRYPVGPLPRIPPGFRVVTTFSGRLLVNADGYSVYTSDTDVGGKSHCTAACLDTWVPMQAPSLAQQSDGEWSVIERAPGVWQWSYRNQPLYTYVRDVSLYSHDGADIPGWHNAYTQRAPDPPKPFQFVDTQKGVAVADARGKTVYSYACYDDSLDQLSCDYPGAPAVYRVAICGGGHVERCLKTWPYVLADANARSDSRLWSIVQIDARTGALVGPGATNGLRVWAYRGRPLYTYVGDHDSGDVNGDRRGEIMGERNGFTALWAREVGFIDASGTTL